MREGTFMTNEQRYRAALETISEDSKRCDDCAEDVPEGEPPIATHMTMLWGAAQYLCDDHADLAREANRKARSKGCGYQTDVAAYAQPAHVKIALAALGGTV